MATTDSTEESASQSAHPSLAIATTMGSNDTFPDFSDPNLFSGLEAKKSVSSDTASELSSTSSAASPVVSNASTSSTSKFLLPLPTPAANMSQTSFTLSEVNVGGEEGGMDALSPEIASADISIAADGSFVETTSGSAARELKRRYDQQLGVNKDIRSPYIITAITSQHGKQVYRVGMRSQAQELTSTPELEMPPNATSPASSTAQRKRRSRMSVASVFSKPNGPGPSPRVADEVKPSLMTGTPGKGKLRKPRSIPDLASAAGGYFGDAAGAPAPSGRAHSHSVTGADMPRPTVQTTGVSEPPVRLSGDLFSCVMGWAGAPGSPLTSSGLTPSSRSLLTPSDTPSQSPLEVCSQHSKEFVEHPFGRNVSFDSPFRSSAIFLPSIIREMQSFESARTARAEPTSKTPEAVEVETPPRPDSLEPPPRPGSMNSFASSNSSEKEQTFDFLPDSMGHVTPRAVPLPETCVYTRYQTAVFDVIQNYRGLPMFDMLSATSRQPTIKMSLSSLDGAIPQDDPRFVIWGDVSNHDNLQDVEKESLHGSSSARSRPQSRVFSTHSRKQSLKGKAQRPPEVREPSPDRRSAAGDGASSASGNLDGSQRVLMAATIERWIAQLTSQFDYDELLIFFLTYRTYIDALDLCHLLICRFHWALEEPTTPHEVMVKQIVRVRTFVAIRYWLLTFFRVDFLPNRELCLLFSNWLNTLWRDPIFDKYNDARNLVKKLKKVAKDCRDAHSKQKRATKSGEQKGKMMHSIDKILGDFSNSVNFAATLRKAAAAQNEDDDSDVDLDFNPEESSPFSDAAGIQGFASFANQLGPKEETTAAKAESSAPSSPSRPSASKILMQQPLHLTILQHARPQSGSLPPLVQTPTSLPVHHSTFSRVVVSTIGRLGRWKRVLSSRTPETPLTPHGAFDLELNATGDLLTVRGGVEQYLKMIEPPASSPISPTMGSLPQVTISTSVGKTSEDSSEEATSPVLTPTPSPRDTEPSTRTPDVSSTVLRPDSPSSIADSESVDTQSLYVEQLPSLVNKTLTRLRTTERSGSVHSDSSGSLRSLGTPIPRNHQSFPDIVSIDDLDYLSDTSDGSEPAQPPGLRSMKRLPNRRDFEFVRRSVDSVSSMGIISRASVALSEHPDSARSSFSSPRGALGSQLHQWQVNAIIDDLSGDEDIPGDAEAALRRLEGQINQKQQKQKELKVNGWVRTIQERMAAGDFRDEQPRFPLDDSDGSGSDEDYGAQRKSDDADEEDVTISLPRSSLDSSNGAIIPDASLMSDAVTPTPRQTTHPINAPHTQSPHAPSAEAKPKVDEAVPEEILLSRIPSRPSTSDGPSAKSSPGQPRSPQTAYSLHKTPGNMPVVHRSFVLYFRAEKLAAHFALIEREIFLGIKFEELVSEQWMASMDETDVRDWMQFLRDRRRKVELRGRGKVSVLSAARARFNLVANFVVSEIALTNPHDRVYVVSKFIRIAWKAYVLNNFATLVAIISGLSNEWVRKAMKRSWSRVGIWENRVFEDLKTFCTSDDDFVYIRRQIAAIVEAKPLTGGGQDESVAPNAGSTDGQSSGAKSRGTTDGKPALPTCCIPFIGVYLSQLFRYSRLPDLIDPSAPGETVDIDSESGNFKAPAHAEVFSDLRPLPVSMQIEPLINIQKQRKIAGVIKALVAGQHLANKFNVDVDKRLLSRCLKLTALDVDELQRIFGVYSDY